MKRLLSLVRKEYLQIRRDPSAILIAFVLPLILLFVFGYGVNLDSNRVRIGLVVEEHAPDVENLMQAFMHSRFLEITLARDRRELEPDMVAGRLRGLVIIPQNFSIKAALSSQQAPIQIIADGSEPNIAAFVNSYARGVVGIWLASEAERQGVDQVLSQAQPPITLEPRFWYNPELKSRYFLLPGSIAIIMTMIGTLLTALVVAREWERGTMEALMATPASIMQILLAKLISYFILGMGSMILCWSVAVFVYDVPFRGSFAVLILATSVFLLGALGQGLLISSATKDQFIASQAALMSAFLPAFMLSGFLFEISSMPLPIQWLTRIFTARYFVTSLQTLFLTGTIWPLLWPCLAAMTAIGAVFFVLTSRKTRKRLDV